MTDKNKKTLKIVLNIIEWIVFVIVILFFVFVMVFASNKPGKSSGGSLFGYETRLVLTDSMNAPEEFYKDKNYEIKNIAAGECIFLSDCNYSEESSTKEFYSNLKIGDVVTYYSTNTYHEYITHRIIDIKETTTQGKQDLIFEIKGDNGESEYTASEKITMSSLSIVGKVVYHSATIGWIYTNLLSNTALLVCLIVIPCVICIAYEVYKIVIEVKASKKEKIELQVQSKDEEIEELKKRIKDLESKKEDNKDDN